MIHTERHKETEAGALQVIYRSICFKKPRQPTNTHNNKKRVDKTIWVKGNGSKLLINDKIL